MSDGLGRGGELLPRIALIALFTAGLVTAQLLAVKILALPVPVLAEPIVVPAGVLAYSITYLASDCYTELYGRREAQIVVNVGFASILLMLALLWLAIVAPGSQQGVDPETFASVVSPAGNVIVASLLAYVASQNWDVIAFHRIRARTGEGLLWVRNLGSTVTSQGIDTVIFILVAFWAMPTLVGVGDALPVGVLGTLILGQYAIKLLIALLDTPFVYLVVGTVRRHTEPTAVEPAAD